MEGSLSILMVLAFVLFASPYISQITKIPISPTEIILGIIAGSFGFLPHNEAFKIVAEVGFFYLMFIAGTEVDLKIFITTERKILKNAFIYLGILYFLSILIINIFDLNKIFYIVLPVIAVGLLGTLYKDYGKNQNWLNLAMLIGTIGEVISITLLTLSGAFMQNGFTYELILISFYLFGFLLISIFSFKFLEILFWWYPNLKLILMPKNDNTDKDIRFAMATFVFIIAIMLILKLEIAFGAFIAGSFIRTFFSHNEELPHKLGSFGFGFLVPIFFVYIGSTVNLSSILIPEVLINTVLITIAMTLLKVIPAFLFHESFNFKEIILVALSLSMPLTLLIATTTIAKQAGYIDNNLYFSFIYASLFEAIICMILIKIIYSLNLNSKEQK